MAGAHWSTIHTDPLNGGAHFTILSGMIGMAVNVVFYSVLAAGIHAVKKSGGLENFQKFIKFPKKINRGLLPKSYLKTLKSLNPSTVRPLSQQTADPT